MALPANVGTTPDASTTRKWYTLTAELRETYDDNVGTTSTNEKSSFETAISPSILAAFPDKDGEFTARYTLNATYYSVGPNSNSNSNGGNSNGSGSSAEFQITNELVAQYTHAFSDRFNLNLADQVGYFTEPNLLQSAGTNYQNGPYIFNTLSGALTAQWAPLWGTTTNYSNTVIKYQDSSVADFQNSMENTGTESVSYALYPKISLSVGAIVDDLSYQTADRGYTTYTGFGGVSWQILPSMSLTVRGGGTYIVPEQGQDTIAPYGALTYNWSLGARSNLEFDYAHEITPSDQVGANGQTSDRFSSTFRYDITSRISSHLSGVFTAATVSNGLSNSNSLNNYQENDYYVDTGLTYHYDNYLDFDLGTTFSGIFSDISNNDYTRDEEYVGVRGTY